MKRLFTIDLKDYNPEWEKFYRPSVRGIIFDENGNIAMVYSRRDHFYKFPGGGIERNESHLETLARELKEETGMTLVPGSMKEFGEVLKIQKGDEAGKDVIHYQKNYYYICEVEEEVGEQNLDDGEKELDFVLRFVSVEEAIRANGAFKNDNVFEKQMAERERRVLGIIQDGLAERKVDRFKTIAAVLVLLVRENENRTEYLLQKRQNTGFADGMWDFSASGHVEKDEPMTTTVCREAKEEINIDVLPENVEFMGLLHLFGDGEPRLLGCFKVSNYSGEISIGEPEKVAELKWFNKDDLPDGIIDSRKKVLERFSEDKVFYLEFGWDD